MNLQKSNYQAWEIKSSDFPYDKGIEDQIRFLVGYANLAPSVHNTQPWQFSVRGNQLTIAPDLSYPLPIADPYGHGLYIALGACAENFRIAAEAYGFTVTSQILDSSVLLALSAEPSQQPDESNLQALKDRHSNKVVYDKASISEETIHSLQNITTDGAQLRLLTSEQDMQFIADMHMQAAKKVVKEQNFVKELLQWLRTNTTKAGDGMPGFVAGNSNLKTRIGLFLFNKKPQIFAKAVLKDKELMSSSSAVALFSALENTSASWLKTGMLIEKVWIAATKQKLVCHPLSPAVHDADTLSNMVQQFNLQGTPVFLMRIGYSARTDKRTPRRAPKWNS